LTNYLRFLFEAVVVFVVDDVAVAEDGHRMRPVKMFLRT